LCSIFGTGQTKRPPAVPIGAIDHAAMVVLIVPIMPRVDLNRCLRPVFMKVLFYRLCDTIAPRQALNMAPTTLLRDGRRYVRIRVVLDLCRRFLGFGLSG
jgi:hypothetical protein